MSAALVMTTLGLTVSLGTEPVVVVVLPASVCAALNGTVPSAMALASTVALKTPPVQLTVWLGGVAPAIAKVTCPPVLLQVPLTV